MNYSVEMFCRVRLFIFGYGASGLSVRIETQEMNYQNENNFVMQTTKHWATCSDTVSVFFDGSGEFFETLSWLWLSLSYMFLSNMLNGY